MPVPAPISDINLSGKCKGVISFGAMLSDPDGKAGALRLESPQFPDTAIICCRNNHVHTNVYPGWFLVKGNFRDVSPSSLENDCELDANAEPRRGSSHICKVGNSTAVRLTQDIMAAAGLALDQPVTMTVSQGMVTIRAAEKDYEKTLSAAQAFAGRYPLLLDKLGD